MLRRRCGWSQWGDPEGFPEAFAQTGLLPRSAPRPLKAWGKPWGSPPYRRGARPEACRHMARKLDTTILAVLGATCALMGADTARAAVPPIDLLTEADLELDGAAAGDFAGSAVAGAGDVDGDGLADVIVGADGVGDDAGAAYAVLGREATTTVDLVRLDGAGFRIAGTEQGDGLGGAVAGAGDVNGDGRPDVIVGADYWSHPASGSAYVVFGSTSSADIDLTNLGGGGFRMDGAAVY